MVEIPKAEGKVRALRIASPRDKIIQKALQLLLEKIYVPKFSNLSHGFSPNKSTHSALKQLHLKGGNYSIAINGDISKCFDSIPHDIIMNILKESIKCHRTLEIINKALKVKTNFKGRILNYTGMGTPHGSVLSPLLTNIVLDKFDKYMENYIDLFNKGKNRAASLEYKSVVQRRYISKDPIRRRLHLNLLRSIPSTNYSNFRRMIYIRYADDFVILIIGNYSEAFEIRQNIKNFLKSLGLELNIDKTSIVQLTKGFKFLGATCFRVKKTVYEKKSSNSLTYRIHRRLIINADLLKIIDKLLKYKFLKRNKHNQILSTSRRDLINLSHYTIVSFYNSKIRGLLSYYSFAGNYSSLNRIISLLTMSCALTLALKFKLKTARKTFGKFGKLLTDPETGVGIYKPKSMKVRHFYNNSIPNDIKIDNILSGSLQKQLTVTSGFDKGCAICGSKTNL